MHLPAGHAEYNPEVLRSFVETHPLGMIITHLPPPDDKPDIAPLQASHIPFTIQGTPDKLVLRAHLARQNPQAKALAAAADRIKSNEVGVTLPEDALVMFTAPAHSHISASFYAETKPSTGKVVPTWDYAAVQAYGPIRVFAHAPEQASHTESFLATQTAALTNIHEPQVEFDYKGEKKVKPWTVNEAPERYRAILHKAILGIEIEVTSIAGRFKLDQEKSTTDWAGIVRGLKANGKEELAQLTLARGRADGKPVPEDLADWAATIPEDVVKVSAPEVKEP